MSRPPNPTPKSRLNLEFSERVRERISRLREITDAESMTEVIRRALALYDAVVETRNEGGTILVRRADGSETEIVFL